MPVRVPIDAAVRPADGMAQILVRAEVTTGTGPLDDAVVALWDGFRDDILEQVTTLEDAAVALLAGELAAGQRDAAAREAHKLAGSVGTFGFAEASRVARSIELLFQGAEALTQADALRMSDWVVALRSGLEAPASRMIEMSADETPCLLIVTAERDLADQLAMEAAGRGFMAERAADHETARQSIKRCRPSAVVLDVDALSAGTDALSLLDTIVADASAPAVVVIGVRDGFRARIEAVRRGGRVFLKKPASPVLVIDAVERSLRRGVASGAKVLVVDDDAHILSAVERMLTARGLKVHAVEEPAKFWVSLGQINPDIAVLDLDMPGLDGIDLCRAVRSDPRWSALPVLFLTPRSDAATIQAIFSAGGDDYVMKPVVGAELVARLENRLERARLHNAAEEAAGPAGLPGWQRTVEEITRLVHLAERAGVDLTVARIDVDGLARVNAQLGSAAGDEVLQRLSLLMQARVRAGDVVGWWGGDEFAVAFFGTDDVGAAQWLEEVLADVAREPIPTSVGDIRITFSAGLSCFPDDGGDLAGLTAASERALAVAKQGGGARVVLHAAHRASALVEMVDIALVEDDPVLSNLLLHAFSMQGYVTRHFGDGETAMAQLAAIPPLLRARLILLDVDLPGHDGLSVLRDLGRAGVLRRTLVMMLTVRSSERDVLMALELGAVEHVAKPFSVPVLLQRVRALLHRR